MPPRKRTAKQAQTALEDAPKPQKRQKKSEQPENVTEESKVTTSDSGATVVAGQAVPAIAAEESNDQLTSHVEDASTGADAKSHDQQLPRIDAKAEEDDDDYEEDVHVQRAIVEQPQKASDLYLDTVNRAALDFDFEKVCSVSLSNINIYGCLVCGKYFQGRSKLTPAFAHSIHDDHHVFMNLETTQVSHSYFSHP